ncbi:hypothetical protein [Rhodococcus sp. H29-C3]|uniref:hypothetical protein n=1 Tax=Rhodococcus sp. H29-C3 TaxID=3046307 RepID=UPI0024BB861E|nr:hypothetical protein [Rhodococcus sp. H29-C3]MDJ0363123.1 hypothetical protein [Rhodococcus sp. H29-C3]
MSILTALDVRASRSDISRTRRELYAQYTKARANAFMDAAYEHHKRTVFLRAVLVMVLLACVIAMVTAVAIDSVNGRSVSTLAIIAPLFSLGVIIFLGYDTRRSNIRDVQQALDTVLDAHTLHQRLHDNT